MKKLIVLYTLLISVNCFGQVPNYVPTDSLVGWWPFNGNANDESGNGYDGIIYGATLDTNRFGDVNSAYELDGLDDYIDCDQMPVLNAIPELTLSVWVKAHMTNSYRRFIGKAIPGIDIKS